jgi:hypothetical protein
MRLRALGSRRGIAILRLVRNGIIALVVVAALLRIAANVVYYYHIRAIQDEITSKAEKEIMESFQQGALQIVSAYPCEDECDKAGRCGSYENGTEISFDSSGGALDEPRASADACLLQDGMCFLVRNTGNTVVRMSDVGAAQVTYEVPEAPELGERPMSSSSIGLSVKDGDGWTCCRLDELSMSGMCGGQKAIQNRTDFVLGFTGTFRDVNGTERRMWYDEVKDQRLIISMNLPTGFKMSHQVV